MTRREKGERDLASVVEQKTKLLIEAKQQFNRLVADVEKELGPAIARWDEETAHISLQTAKDLIVAIKSKRSLLPPLIGDLREGLEFTRGESDGERSDGEPPPAAEGGVGPDLPVEEEEEEGSLDSGGALSGEELPPDLQGKSFDAEGYLRQYDQRDDLVLDEFQDLGSD
jgi:hypothetical protein